MPKFDLEERIPLDNIFDSHYAAITYDMSLRRTAVKPHKVAANTILSNCKEGFQLVEVGACTGLTSLYISANFPQIKITGFEENPFLYDVASSNLNLCCWAGAKPDIKYKKNSLTQLPLSDDSADIVFSFGTLHLWENPVAVLKECARICKKDGLVIIEDLNRQINQAFINLLLLYKEVEKSEFLKNLRSTYSKDETLQLLKEAGLDDWIVNTKEINLVISSREV
ncbi:class I SAM-dependent methyltransferase [Ruminiclostridium cellulolyticum]|uniref:Methyltransferase type 11 n=1 Tax=Ruminiclostridium cellulolyticum (strain ATCC 35319 / DSM 5812 / JCM 6584 / H10) TaxID=394503 RepID=B8I962_RUMCH|nr:class I SAM-dependent methyltransferase [Ruminiclostridium cellulolyticum]ACL75322.1 Methyltransferase type 11 [Ruminiclostridium cellulolyticum H10]